MHKKKTISRQRTLELLQEEIAIFRLEETVAPQLRRAIAQRTDFDSLVIKNLLEKRLGRRINDPRLIDEGLWEKAKGMLAKLRFSKGTGASKQKDELQASLDAAADQKFNELFGNLKTLPGFDEFPNNEKQEEFVAMTSALFMVHQAISSAHKQGTVETGHANELVTKLRSYAEGLKDDLSYSYRYLNEDDEEDEEDDEDILEEAPLVNLNRVLRLVQRGKMSPMDAIEKIQNTPGVRKRTKRAAIDQIKDIGKEMYPGPTPSPDVPDVTPPAPGPPRPPRPKVPGVPGVPLGHTGVGATGLNPSSMASLYTQAGKTGGSLLGYLGGNMFLANVAGFALPVAAIGGILGLVGKRVMGHSREGGLKNIISDMTDLDEAEFETEKVKDPAEDIARPEDEEEGAPGGEAEMAAGDAFTYTSGGGAQSAVKVDDPNPNPSKPNLVSVHRIDPASCQDVPNSEFAASKQAFGDPIDKCDTPAAGGEAAPGGEAEAAPGEEAAAGEEWDPSLGEKPPQNPDESDEAYAGRLRMAAAARRRGVSEALDRWHKLAGIIKG